MTQTSETTAAASVPSGGEEVIVARAGRYYRNTRYAFVAAMLIFAAWFAYDGWVVWPREAQLNRENPKAGKPHTDTDIRWQRALSCILPPVAIVLLVRWLYLSRGAYRLAGNVLSVPGHPDIPLDAIRQMDKSLWDRKGIASVEYELGPGRSGWAFLDDFVYAQKPTDEIVERIEKHLASSAPAAPGETQSEV